MQPSVTSAPPAPVDPFARDNLPPREGGPELLFERPELQYPDRLNCATALLDEALARGWGGRTAIIAPGGRILAGPLEEKEGLLTATIDLDRCAEGRGMFDPTGHYSRPDVLSLSVDTARKAPVVRAGDPGPSAPPQHP